MLNDIEIKSIPHTDHRYPTVGDYWTDKFGTHFRVSQMSDWRYEFLVLFHEMFEWAGVKYSGISEQDVDDFDKKFELERSVGLHIDNEEPGFDKRAPYRKWHIWATRFERVAAFLLGVKWKEYNDEVNSL